MPRRSAAGAVAATALIVSIADAAALEDFVPLVDVPAKAVDETYSYSRCAGLYISMLNLVTPDELGDGVYDTMFYTAASLASVAVALRMESDDISLESASDEIQDAISAFVGRYQERYRINAEESDRSLVDDPLIDSDVETCRVLVQTVSEAGLLQTTNPAD